MRATRSILLSLAAVTALALLPWVGVKAGLTALFAVWLPYMALATFVVGVVYRVVVWARSPVPFNITTTCGQQASLPWVEPSRLESPSSTLGVVGRMALEVLFFRSLFRNTKAELRQGPKLLYSPALWLWLAGLAFHWSLLVIVLRHLRLFVDPVPAPLVWLNTLDSFFQIGVPALYLTDAAIVAAVTFLFLRRVGVPQLRYLSLPADYFPLILILGIAVTGMDVRYLARTDVAAAKELAVGLASLKPHVPEGIGSTFYIHLFLVSVLLAYLPFSKLMHLGGVFLSPTRNLANDSRARRHVNPWDGPVKVHTYEEYEDEFRDKMKAAGLPVEKE